MNKRRRWVFRACLLALGGLVSLALAEGILRLYVAARGWTTNCYAASVLLFRPHPELGYDLAPGFHSTSGAYRITINALGLRGPEIAREKPPGVLRIAVLGESSVFGYFVSDGDEACRLLETLLRREDAKVEVVNAGVPGYNLFQTRQRFADVVAPLAPDIVVVYLGWNDLPYITAADPDAKRFRVRPVAPAWERLLAHSTLFGLVRYRLMAGELRLAPAEASLAQPTAAGAKQFDANVKRLLAAIRQTGASILLCSQALAAQPEVAADLRASLGRDPEVVERMIALGSWLRETLRRLAEDESLPFVDVASIVPPTGEYLADYVHLTPAGEARLAEVWLTSLRPLLAERRRR